MLGWLFLAISIAGWSNFPTTPIAAQGSGTLCLARSFLFNITCVGVINCYHHTAASVHVFRTTSLVMWASAVHTERSLVNSTSIASPCDAIQLSINLVCIVM